MPQRSGDPQPPLLVRGRGSRGGPPPATFFGRWVGWWVAQHQFFEVMLQPHTFFNRELAWFLSTGRFVR